jgi:hypothetical protein
MIVQQLDDILQNPLSTLEWDPSGTPERSKPILGKDELIAGNEMAMAVARHTEKVPDEIAKRDDEYASFISPSKAGHCVVKLCLDKVESPKEPLSTRSRLNFVTGDLLEAAYRYIMRKASFDGFEFIEMPAIQGVEIDGVPERSYYDGIIKVRWDLLANEVGGSEDWWKDRVEEHGEWFSILFEMKTKSDYGFKELQKSRKMGYKRRGRHPNYEYSFDDWFGYRTQTGLMIRQAYKDHLINIPMGVWLVINKNTGGTLEIYESMKTLQADIDAGDETVRAVKAFLDGAPMPPRPQRTDRNGVIPGFPCGYCDHKYACWADEPVAGFKKREDSTDPLTRWEPVYENEPREKLHLFFEDGKPQWQV